MPGNVHQSIAATSISRRVFLCAGAASLLAGHRAGATDANEMQTALAKVLRNTRATACIVDQFTGKAVAQHGDVHLATTPGSILKPLVLFGALKQGIVSPATTVFCRRDLHIGNKPYPCTHPQSNVAFNAQEALAYSCNTWLAALALRMTAPRLTDTLRTFQLHPSVVSGSPQNNQLLALGLRGIATSTFDIAKAYSILAQQLHQPFAQPITAGLRDSVSFGMAHNADTQELEICGKTGTADRPPRELWSHGWFAGFATIRKSPLVVSIYLPQANGADAALIARSVFLACNEATA
jgi:penicillin-binding protein 2